MSSFKIREISGWVHPVGTRMPFRFGIAEMRQMPHLFIRLTLEGNRGVAQGMAADHLLPKWFTKNPATSYQEDIRELQNTVFDVCRIARAASAEPTPFRLWWEVYHEQARQSALKGTPSLLASFGASLIERALIDAYCRLQSQPLQTALRENSLGIELDLIHRELKDRLPAEFLPASPRAITEVRHTVGLSDALTDADLKQGEWPDDGLPVSLEACIQVYGVSSFKIKISDKTETNIARLCEIVRVLERNLGQAYSFTLDGNESYRSVETFRELWERILSTPELEQSLDRLTFVEQPLHRDVALSQELGQGFQGCSRLPRVIIDESDATLATVREALACGYAGTTHKNCKGVFKSVANLALLKLQSTVERPLILSGEDLTNIGPIALLQDLCVVQNLGLKNVERNGHHYFRGLENFPQSIWEPLLTSHPDLFRKLPDACPTMRIEGGILKSESLHQKGLGPAFDLNPVQFTPLEEWRVESMNA